MHTSARLPVLAVLALIVTGVAGCLEGFGTLEAPKWETGYSFAYAGTGSYRVDAIQKENGEVVDEVHEAEDDMPFDYFLEVLDDDYDAAGEPVYLSALTIPALGEAMAEAGLDGLSAFPVGIRHRDLATLYPGMSYQQQCTNGDCEADVEYTFAQPDDDMVFLDFPFQKGDSWSYTEAGGGLNTTVRFEAEGAETVETPLGSFTAVRIAVGVAFEGLDELLEATREEAAAQGLELEVLEMDLDAAATLWYSPDHGAVVKTAARYQETAHAVFRHEGDRYEARLDAHGESLEHLVGARLVPGPDRSQSNIRQVFLGGEHLVDPTGESVPAGGAYGIDLVADQNAVNAAEAPTVAFTVTATDALPGDHSLRIDLRGPDGALVTKSATGSLQHVFDDPGLFIAQAYALDADGDVQATDAAVVIANFEARIPGECLPVTSGLAAALACDPVELPVRNGIRSLEVSFIPSATSAVPELVVTDPEGNEASGGMTVRIEDFSGHAVDGRDWVAQWQPAAGVLEDGDYLVHLHYGGAGSGAEDGMEVFLPRGAGLAFRGLDALWGGTGASIEAGGSALHIVTRDLN